MHTYSLVFNSTEEYELEYFLRECSHQSGVPMKVIIMELLQVFKNNEGRVMGELQKRLHERRHEHLMEKLLKKESHRPVGRPLSWIKKEEK